MTSDAIPNAEDTVDVRCPTNQSASAVCVSTPLQAAKYVSRVVITMRWPIMQYNDVAKPAPVHWAYQYNGQACSSIA